MDGYSLSLNPPRGINSWMTILQTVVIIIIKKKCHEEKSCHVTRLTQKVYLEWEEKG